MLNRAAPRTRLAATLDEAMAELPVPRAESTLKNRVAYAESLGAGTSVVETAPRGPAAAEIGALWAEVTALMEL